MTWQDEILKMNLPTTKLFNMNHAEIINHVKNLINNLDLEEFEYDREHNDFNWYCTAEDEIYYNDGTSLLFSFHASCSVAAYAEEWGQCYDKIGETIEIESLIYYDSEGEDYRLEIEKELTNLLKNKIEIR